MIANTGLKFMGCPDYQPAAGSKPAMRRPLCDYPHILVVFYIPPGATVAETSPVSPAAGGVSPKFRLRLVLKIINPFLTPAHGKIMCKRTFARQHIPTFHETNQPNSEAKTERVLGACIAGGYPGVALLEKLFNGLCSFFQ
jgi:hypothetical protein